MSSALFSSGMMPHARRVYVVMMACVPAWILLTHLAWHAPVRACGIGEVVLLVTALGNTITVLVMTWFEDDHNRRFAARMWSGLVIACLLTGIVAIIRVLV